MSSPCHAPPTTLLPLVRLRLRLRLICRCLCLLCGLRTDRLGSDPDAVLLGAAHRAREGPGHIHRDAGLGQQVRMGQRPQLRDAAGDSGVAAYAVRAGSTTGSTT
eukprot:2996943-Rhodomonas_salina.2